MYLISYCLLISLEMSARREGESLVSKIQQCPPELDFSGVVEVISSWDASNALASFYSASAC